MTAVGLDPTRSRSSRYADEWYRQRRAPSSSSTAAFDGRRFDAGFGAEGVLQNASGQLAVPARPARTRWSISIRRSPASTTSPGSTAVGDGSPSTRRSPAMRSSRRRTAGGGRHARGDVVRRRREPSPERCRSPEPDPASTRCAAGERRPSPAGARAGHGDAGRRPGRRVVGLGRRRLGVAAARLPVHR